MRACVALLLAAACAEAPCGERLPDAPLLRVDTERHTAFIHALALDESAGRAYSASEDKTVRVWRIADGRLLDTFRVPIGHRAEGQLYALALSPDRSLLAVGGWTCWDAEDSGCVYLLDAASGALRGRISGVSEVIAALRFSPDGRHLAVGLMGAQGLRVYRVADRLLVAEDRDYRDKLLELDFSAAGHLVTSSLDGFVRLYDARFLLLGRVNAGLAGREPFGVRFSPDGRQIALGFNDVARVSILRATDLIPVVTLVLDSGAVPRNLTRVAWSADGARVYAAGESDAARSAALFRWRVADPTRAQALTVARGRIGDIAVTREHRVLFAADDPALGMLEPSGKARYFLTSGVPRFGAASELRVSSDATLIEIGRADSAATRRRFSVTRQRLEPIGAGAEATLGPVTHAPGVRIERWGGAEQPLLNGRLLPLEPYERAHVRAFAHDGSLLVVGTEWAVRAFDRSAAPRWTVRTPTVVRALSVSADGRFVVAALGDGTLHWYALATGETLLSLFLHADGENWVAWTPDAHYASSPYGDTFVGWHVNRGPDLAPDFFRAVQFERELYRPEILAARLDKGRPSPHASSAEAASLLAIAPPRLTLTGMRPPSGIDAGTRRLRVTGESLGLPMRDLVVYVNDIPLTAARDRALGPAHSARFMRDVEVPLSAGDNVVRVEVSNGRSLGVSERLITADTARPGAAPQGDLYVLTVGANEFPDLSPRLHLSYAARDAQEFARAMRQIGARHFRNTYVRTLSDTGPLPTRAAVLDSLRALTQTTGNDTVVLFLASHGVSDSAGNYYFVPRDVRRGDLDRLLDGHALPPNSSLVGWAPFFDALRNAAGRRLLIVDTCQARNITGRSIEHSLAKRSASSRIGFVLASKGDEKSQEYAAAHHGLFTYALLEGLKGAADADRDGQTRLSEWFTFATGVVERLRDRRVGPQTPQLIAPPSLRALPILAGS